MQKPKNVFVVMERFCDLNPALGTTSAYSNVVGSLISAEIDHKVMHYDEFLFENYVPMDDVLIKTVKEEKPDLVAVSYYPVPNDSRNIKMETFQAIKDAGIPVVFIWFDFGHPHIRDLACWIGSRGTKHVVVDTCKVPEDKIFLPMWVPQDERVFKWCGSKSKDVCFVGTTRGYPTRQHYLEYLQNKVPVFISGGQREHKLTIEEYAEVLRQSKISINFPDKSDGTIQAKCRIYESILCGAMLLEKDNDAIREWFQPMLHYVPFNNEMDLVEKIQYYVYHPEERELIAQRALNKMREDYSSDKWWSTVYTKAVS